MANTERCTQYEEYIKEVLNGLEGKRFKARTRRELEVKITQFHAMSERNGAVGDEAVRSTLGNMGTPEQLAQQLGEKYTLHLSMGGTIALATLIIVFFIAMGVFSSGGIFTQFKPLTILLILGFTALFSALRSIRHLTMESFVGGIAFGGSLTAYFYAIFHMYLFYFDSTLTRAKEMLFIRGNIEQLLLIIVYGFILALVGDVLTKRLYPPVDAFVDEIFEDKRFRALRSNSRMIFVNG